MGDPAGIGPEIIVKSLAEGNWQEPLPLLSVVHQQCSD